MVSIGSSFWVVLASSNASTLSWKTAQMVLALGNFIPVSFKELSDSKVLNVVCDLDDQIVMVQFAKEYDVFGSS